MHNILFSKANHVIQNTDTTELPEQHAEEFVITVTHILPKLSQKFSSNNSKSTPV